MPQPADGAPPRGEPDRVLYLVATVHLDTQWRWTVRDTIARFLPDTLRRNFDAFRRFPSYVLNFDGAFRYMLAREYYPREYEEFVRQVAAGRWHVAGCMLDAPDVNVPSPESLIRQVLYAKRFFDREFGTHGRDVFLPDCFGFSWALPAVARHCGLIGFSTSKLVRWVQPARPPFDLGWWEGPDGSRILAALNPDGYGEKLASDPRTDEVWTERIESSGKATGVWAAFRYFGTGDRGGAPDDESLAQLESSLLGDSPVRVVHGGSDRVFGELTAEFTEDPERAAGLPVHRGELLLPTHGTGCFTSQAVLKRWNRKNELLADAAERAALAADWLGAAPYPRARLEAAWLRFLWHQMHDDLTGTSIPAAYRLTWNDEVIALNQFATVLTDSVGAVARGLDTRVEGAPIVVYNPLAFEREDVVEARVPWQGAPAAALRVFDSEGAEVPSQMRSSDADGADFLFVARLPPVGFSVFEVRESERPFTDLAPERAPQATTGAGFHGLENQLYRVEIHPSGDVARLFDKRLGRELLAAPAGLELLRDRSHRWPAWEMHYDEVRAPARERFGAPAEIRIVESGPARAAIEVRRRAAGSVLVQTVRLARGGDRLEIDNRLDWRSRNRMLKAVFPTAAESPTATYDIGVGAIERGNNRPEKYEVPAQQWADLTDRSGTFGVSILNDSKYGWDKPADGTLRLTLARSPGVFRKFVHQARQDHGPHRFLYALTSHAGGWPEGGTVERAARLNQPLLAFACEPGPGTLGRELSLLTVAGEGVATRALKRSEDNEDNKGAAWVVRLQETRGRRRDRVRVSAPAAIASAREVDGCETDVGAASVEDGALVASLGPFQPRAFALRPGPPPAPVSPPRWRPLDFERDLPAASFHNGGTAVDFDGSGRSLPGELLPAVIESGGIELFLAPGGASGETLAPGSNHCLACRGQLLELAPGYGEVVILAAAVGGDAAAELAIDGETSNLTVQDWAAPIGQWARRRRVLGIPLGMRSPFLRRTPIAWLGTHRHDRALRDLPYELCYLFRYRIPTPPAARTLRLPANERIRLFAASQVADSNLGARPASRLY